MIPTGMRNSTWLLQCSCKFPGAHYKMHISSYRYYEGYAGITQVFQHACNSVQTIVGRAQGSQRVIILVNVHNAIAIHALNYSSL